MSKLLINRQAVIDRNSDPITGEVGSHPVAVGVGAAVVGAIGTAIGAVVGPFGIVAGAAIGGILGGLVGKSAAEAIDPTVRDTGLNRRMNNFGSSDNDGKYIQLQPELQPGSQYFEDGSSVRSRLIWNQDRPLQPVSTPLLPSEDEYWRQHFSERPYYESGLEYEDYLPAYRVGYEGYNRYRNTGMSYEEVEPELQQMYERGYPIARLDWQQARYAVRDAWQRVEAAFRVR
jgi:hypothetical protein